MGRIDDRLRELSVTLPASPKPVANYVPAKRTGALAAMLSVIDSLDRVR